MKTSKKLEVLYRGSEYEVQKLEEEKDRLKKNRKFRGVYKN